MGLVPIRLASFWPRRPNLAASLDPVADPPPAAYKEAEAGWPAWIPEEAIEEEVPPAVSELEPIRAYLNQISRVPLLEREQEAELGRRIEAGQRNLLGPFASIPVSVRTLVDLAVRVRKGESALEDLIVFPEGREVSATEAQRILHTFARIGALIHRLEPRQRSRAYVRRDRPEVLAHPRTHPSNRSESPEEVAAREAHLKLARHSCPQAIRGGTSPGACVTPPPGLSQVHFRPSTGVDAYLGARPADLVRDHGAVRGRDRGRPTVVFPIRGQVQESPLGLRRRLESGEPEAGP